MKASCSFFIIRHGQTDWNVQGKIQGHTDIPLNEEGKLQAKQLAESLRTHSFSAAFSSDLSRARETAEIIANPHQLKIETSAQLRERFYGAFEGSLWEDLRKNNQELWTLCDEQAESRKEVQYRVMSYLSSIGNKHKEKNVLLVTHGGVIHTLLSYFEFNPSGQFRVSNASYLQVKYEEGKFQLIQTVGIE